MQAQRHETRSSDGTLIPYWTSGEGHALLFVHGAAGTHDTWEMMRDRLDDRCTVAIMNRRITMGDPLARLDMEREFEDVAAVANALDGPAALFGHSSGALCAIGAAARISNLARLILYEPPLERGDHYAVALEKMWQLLRAGDVEAVYDTWLKEYVRVPAAIADQVKASPVGASMLPWSQYLPREMAAHLEWAFDAQTLASVLASVVYLVGSETPMENVELRGFIPLLDEALANLAVRELPGQGHFANFFAPNLLAEAIAESIGI